MNWSHAPVSLIPGAFPRKSFDYVQNLQPSINALIDKISRNRAFLKHHLGKVADADPFAKKLLEIYESVDDKLLKEGVQMGILRSDYMLNTGTVSGEKNDAKKQEEIEVPLQIEINTIASSFGCLAKKVGELQKYLIERNADDPVLASIVQSSDITSM